MRLKTRYDDIGKIVFISDIHADLSQLMLILKEKSDPLITDSLEWIGGKTHVVVLGDFIDGGGRHSPGVTEEGAETNIITLLGSLKEQAQAVGGDVIIILGNHEYMHTLVLAEGYPYKFPYVSATGESDFGGLENRANLFGPGGEVAIYLAKYCQYCAIINGILCTHMGVTYKIGSRILEQYPPQSASPLLFDRGFKDINAVVARYLKRGISLDQETMDVLFSANIFGYDEEKTRLLNEKLGVVKQIVGHYPACEVKITKPIIFCDNMLSKAFDCRDKVCVVYDGKPCTKTKNQFIRVDGVAELDGSFNNVFNVIEF
jgi:hypothetical protein